MRIVAVICLYICGMVAGWTLAPPSSPHQFKIDLNLYDCQQLGVQYICVRK